MVRTRVGEVNVVESMLLHGAIIGGEGNGGVIVPSINPCRDSFVGMALILEALALEGGNISDLRAKIPTYAIVKEKIACPSRKITPALRRLRDAYQHDTMDLIDGVKILYPDRWVQARGSNTEPIIRVTAEAPTEEDAQRLARAVMGQIEEELAE